MRVLLGDDYPDLVETLKLMLETERDEVTQASDGVEAADLASKGSFDAVVLDIDMPRMTGYEAAPLVRALQPQAMLIAFSGYAGEEYRRKGMEAGFQHYLSKFETESLLNLLAARRLH